jgi:hypothetical protein
MRGKVQNASKNNPDNVRVVSEAGDQHGAVVVERGLDDVAGHAIT